MNRLLVVMGFLLAGILTGYAAATVSPTAFLESLHSGQFGDGHGKWVILLAIAVGTLLSEDLACIGAGLLAGSGRIDLPSAMAAAYAGILVGDTLIFLLGRLFGKSFLRHRVVAFFIPEKAVNRAVHLVHRYGLWIILITRFLPGTRTATYFTAGALHAPAVRFILVFALASALWTPLLVGLSYLIGVQLLVIYETYEAFTIPFLLLAVLFLYLLFHYGIPVLTWRGRRQLRGKWLRATRWEFWPWWQVNAVVFLYVLFIGVFRFRNPLLFTAVNPAMPHGGFIGESKSRILSGLEGAGDAVAQWHPIPHGSRETMFSRFKAAMAESGLSYPVVLKPDEGQRGLGVGIIRDEAAAAAWLGRATTDAMLQEFVSGKEYGIFYIRHPDEESGRIISITTKTQLEVTGNGTDSLEILILRHPRAIALLDTFLARFDTELERVPAAGERIPLGELGTHALGALFEDGRALLTPALTERVDAIAKTYAGFHFGRFDIIVPDEASLQAGKDLRVIELNGLTSEATHIYDPRYGLRQAWVTLCGQWRTAFEIGQANRRAGAPTSTLRQFLRDFISGIDRQRRIAHD